MGEPILTPIATTIAGDEARGGAAAAQRARVDGQPARQYLPPNCAPDLAAVPIFWVKTNTEFVQVISRLKMKVDAARNARAGRRSRLAGKAVARSSARRLARSSGASPTTASS